MLKLPVTGKILATVFLLAFAVRLIGLDGPLIKFIPPIIFSLFAGYAIYLAGKKLKNRKTGLYAAIFFLFNPLVVLYSQQTGTVMIVTFILALLFYAFCFFKESMIRAGIAVFAGVTIVIEGILLNQALITKPVLLKPVLYLFRLVTGNVFFEPKPLYYTVLTLWTVYIAYLILQKQKSYRPLVVLLGAGVVLTSILPVLHVLYLTIPLSLLIALSAKERAQRIRVVLGFLFFVSAYLLR